MLRPNLEALARRDPELVQRICWPVESDHVVIEESGDVVYRLHQGRYRLSLTADAVARSLPPGAPEGSEIFAFGVGLGEQVEAILGGRRDLRVVAWERDPWLVRLALGQNDWAAALASGRLRLLLGSDLVEHAAATATSRATAAAARPAGAAGGLTAGDGLTVLHPFLATVYRHERTWLQPGDDARARPLALICAGGLFTDDLTGALMRLGFAPYTIDIQRLSREELDRTVSRLRPTLIAAINYAEGLAEFAAAHGCRLLCWQVDPTTSAPPRAAGPIDGAFLFTYRRAQVAELRAGGFHRVEYLPLAADLERRAPVPLTGAERDRYGAPLSFVGSSLQPQVAGFRQSFLTGYAPGRPGAVGEAARLLEELLAEQRRDFSRFVVGAALERLCPDLARTAPDHLSQLARWAGEIAAAEKRMAYVGRLVRFGVRVWGDEGWRAIVQRDAGASGGVGNAGDGAGTGADDPYRGPAGHALELTKIYCATLINVDIGRVYQDDIVTMRVFDVLACGGFVLAERSPALAELFEVGAEVDCYATADELEAKVAHYLAHPEAARAIAFRGREAVRRRHDINARVAHMVSVSGADRRQVGR
jgi:hypothetical protein